MAREIIKTSGNNLMYHHTGIRKFQGCQCINDCSCNEDFKPIKYDYYSVVRKGIKTTIHKDFQEAEQRWNFIINLTPNKKQNNETT